MKNTFPNSCIETMTASQEIDAEYNKSINNVITLKGNNICKGILDTNNKRLVIWTLVYGAYGGKREANDLFCGKMH